MPRSMSRSPAAALSSDVRPQTDGAAIASGGAGNPAQLASLRRQLARFDPYPSDTTSLTSGFAPIDAYLAQHAPQGGLVYGGVHDVCAARPGDMASALGFASHLAARFAGEQTLLFGQTHADCRETGRPYMPALCARDIAPHQWLYLDGAPLNDLLWAAEEALTCPAIGCVVLASLQDAPDFTASRRLTLAARAAGRPLIMVLGAAAAGQASAAQTRWQVRAVAGQGWRVRLDKLRGRFDKMPPRGGWQVFPQRPVIAASPDAGSNDNHHTTALPLRQAQA